MDFMDGPAETPKHAAGVCFRIWLAEDFVARDDDCVGAKIEAIAGVLLGIRRGACFFQGQTANIIAAQLARAARFVEKRSPHLERNSGITKDFRAAGRGRCEDQFHRRSRARKALHIDH